MLTRAEILLVMMGIVLSVLLATPVYSAGMDAMGDKKHLTESVQQESTTPEIRRPPTDMELLAEFRRALEDAENTAEILGVYERYVTRFARMQTDVLLDIKNELLALDIEDDLEERRAANSDLLNFTIYRTIQPDSAIYFGKRAYGYLINHSPPQIYFSFVSNLIWVLLQAQEYLTAESYLLASIEELENIPESELDLQLTASLSNFYLNAGTMYSRIRAYDQAAFMFEKALEIRTAPNSECNTRLSLAGIYYEMDMLNEASAILEECLNNKEIIPDISAQISITQHRIYKARGDTLSAVRMLQSAIPYAEEGRSTLGQMTLINSYLTNIFLDLNDTEQAQVYAEYILSLEPNARIIPDILAFAHYEAARYLYMIQAYERALVYAGYVTNIFNLPVALQHEQADNIYALKAAIYEELGDTESALQAYSKQAQHFNRIEVKEREIARSSAQVRYQLILSEAELTAAIQAQEKSSFRFLIATIIALATIFIAFILFTKFRKSKGVIKEKDKALTKAELETQRLKEFANKQTALLREREQKENVATVIKFHNKVSLSAEIISHIQSDGNYVRIYYQKNGDMDCEIIRMSLKQCESLLADEIFYRIHRQIIVNINFINNILSDELYLKNGTHLQIGKKYKDTLDFSDEKNENAA